MAESTVHSVHMRMVLTGWLHCGRDAWSVKAVSDNIKDVTCKVCIQAYNNRNKAKSNANHS